MVFTFLDSKEILTGIMLALPVLCATPSRCPGVHLHRTAFGAVQVSPG
jgi:hypothetical protein